MISSSQYRPQLLLLLCANTPTHRTSDSEATHLLMISDILNNPNMNPPQALSYYLKYQLNPTDSMNARIRGALSNQRITFALTNLLRIHFFRQRPAIIWNVNQMYKWQRAALSILTPYMEWMVLLFNVLASTHSLAVSDPYPADPSTIDDEWKRSINDRLEQFELLPFVERAVYLDIFNPEFFHIVFDTWDKHLHPLAHMYGENLSPQDTTKYSDAWARYQADILDRLFKWITQRKIQVEDDKPLEDILNLMPHRLQWIIKEQVVSGFRIPALPTKTGILMPSDLTPLLTSLTKIEESLIIVSQTNHLVNYDDSLLLEVLSQFDSMAAYELRSDRHHSPDNITYLDMVEANYIRHHHVKPSPLQIRQAVCQFVGVILRNRNSGFESMRLLNGSDRFQAEQPPLYVARITKGKNKAPALSNAIESISKILKVYCKDGLERVSEDAWHGLDAKDDRFATSRSLLTRAFKHTASPWAKNPYARTGNSNRSNYMTLISSWFFLSTHAAHSTSVEANYKEIGYDQPYMNNPRIYRIIDDITSLSFGTWHQLVKPDGQMTHTGTTEATMPMRRENIISASSFINDVYQFIRQSPMFSIHISTTPTTYNHSITNQSSQFMDSVIQVCLK